MVPQANEGVLHDFATDPIRLRLRPDDNAWLMATGTTLGRIMALAWQAACGA